LKVDVHGQTIENKMLAACHHNCEV